MPGTTVTDFTAESPPPPTKCSLCLKVIRKLLSFLLSHIGLLSLVVGYCIMGAFIFEELERHNEIEVKRNMTKNRLLVTDDLWEITKYVYSPLIFAAMYLNERSGLEKAAFLFHSELLSISKWKFNDKLVFFLF